MKRSGGWSWSRSSFQLQSPSASASFLAWSGRTLRRLQLHQHLRRRSILVRSSTGRIRVIACRTSSPLYRNLHCSPTASQWHPRSPIRSWAALLVAAPHNVPAFSRRLLPDRRPDGCGHAALAANGASRRDTSGTLARLVSVAKGKIAWQNGHFQGFRRQVLLANGRRDVSHLRDNSPPHRTVCRCRPLPDGQRRGWAWPGGSRLAELSRGAAAGAADELCRSRTAAAGRAA